MADTGRVATTVVEPKASGGVVGRNCPYCHFPLKEGAPVTGCEFCHAVHHADCWSDNGGCAVASCQGGPDGSASPAMPTPVMPAAARPADKLHVDFGPAAAPAPQPARATAGGSERHGRRLWVGLVVAVIVAILAGGATAAALIVSKKDDGDTSGSAQGTDVAGEGEKAPPPGTTGGAAPKELGALSNGEIKSKIVEVITKNIQLVAAEDYKTAWKETLSKKYKDWKKAEDGYDDWEKSQKESEFRLNQPVEVEIRPTSTDVIEAVVRSGISTIGGDNPLSCYCGVTWFLYKNGEMRWDIGYGSDPERAEKWRGRCENIGKPAGCTGPTYSRE